MTTFGPSERAYRPPPQIEPYVFVPMPFEALWSDNAYDAITQACGETARARPGLRAERANHIPVPGRITDQITSATSELTS